MYDVILVATDGSGSANRAVVHALEQSEQYDATLHGIFVVDTGIYDEPALSSAELVTDGREDVGRDALNEIDERATDLEVDFVARCCHGKPHDEIVSYADEIDADLVVMGYQGETHSMENHLGSTTDRVVRTAGRPVLVV